MKGKTIVRTAACFLFFGSIIAGGASQQGADVECKTTNPIEEFPEGLARFLDVVIGEDTVETIRQKLGNSKSVRVSESEGSEICYRLGGAKDRTYVIFEFGPLGGFNGVTGYRISGAVGKKTEASCATLQGAQKVEIPNGLRLGITKAQFKRAVGGRACDGPEAIRYSYEGKRRMSSEELARFSERNPGAAEDPFFDVRAGISGRFGPSGLRELSVYKTESY